MFDGCQVFDTCVYMHVGCLMPVCMGVSCFESGVCGCQVFDIGVYGCQVCMGVGCLMQKHKGV